MSDSPQPVSPKRLVRVVLWTTSILFCLLVALVIGLRVYTQTEGFRTWLRGQVLVALRDAIRGEVELAQVSGDVWNGVTFHNLSLRDTTGEVIHIPQATVSLKLLSQLRLAWASATLRIDEVSVQSPTLRLGQNSAGVWNIAQLFPPSTDSSAVKPFRLFIDRIRISEGHLIVDLPEQKTVHTKPHSRRTACPMV